MLTKLDKKWITRNFITKSDFKTAAKKFATKDDLKRFATKDDLLGLAKASDIEDLKITFVDNLTKWKDELFTKIDTVLGRLKTAEEENIVLRSKNENCHEGHEQFDKRLKQLEIIHPGNHHQN